jgi:hypothetical protein
MILVAGFSPPRGFPRIIFVFYCICDFLSFSDPTTIGIGLSNCNCVTIKFKILTPPSLPLSSSSYITFFSGIVYLLGI